MSKLLSIIPALLSFIKGIFMYRLITKANDSKHQEKEIDELNEEITRHDNRPRLDSDVVRLFDRWIGKEK